MEIPVLHQMKRKPEYVVKQLDGIASHMQGYKFRLDKKALSQELNLLALAPASTLYTRTWVGRLFGRLWQSAQKSILSLQLDLLDQVFKSFLARPVSDQLAERFAVRKAQLFDRSNALGSLFQLWVLEQYPTISNILFSAASIHALRPLETFKVSILIQYLPKFVLWNLVDATFTQDKIIWTKHLARGGNIRNIEIPNIKISKKEAHFFHHAPYFLKYSNAFLYAKMKAKGTNELLFNLVKNNFNGNYNCTPFWDNAIAFLIRHQADLERNMVNQFIGFFRHQEDENNSFSFKGRTLQSVQKLVTEWYAEMEGQGNPNTSFYDASMFWKGANYRNFEIEADGNEFKIIQLTSSEELNVESSRLSHCVRTYVNRCAQGNCSIWSLRQYHKKKENSLVTIELDSSGKLIQAKAKYNATPDEFYLQLIRKWADQENIFMDRLN